MVCQCAGCGARTRGAFPDGVNAPVQNGERIAAFVDALHTLPAAQVPRFEVAYYCEHALGSGSEASAIAYIQIRLQNGQTRWGAGIDTNIELASIKAVLSALNRA